MSTRSPLKWLVRHGVLRGVLRYAACRGEPLARLSVDPRARQDPYRIYAWCRRQGPIWQGRLTMVAVSHEAVSAVLRSENFRVGLDVESLPWPVRKSLVRKDPRILGPIDPPSLLAVNPPSHTRYRRLVGKVFTPRAISALEPRVRQVADELLDEMARKSVYGGVADLVTEQQPR